MDQLLTGSVSLPAFVKRTSGSRFNLRYEAGMAGEAIHSEFFVGGAVEPWSERVVLEHIHGVLAQAGRPFVILANFQLAGRQLDCVVVTGERVLVIEVKASRHPVRGGHDGDWQRLDAAGHWHSYTNGYQQALAAKNRLRDAMRKHEEIGGFYPEALVLFALPLPEGSALTGGDFKVVVTELDRLDLSEPSGQTNPWNVDEWRAFAEAHSLRPATLDEVVGGTALAPAFDLLRDYRAKAAAELDRDGLAWLPESEEQRSDLLGRLDASPGCYLSGPSGCGKTLAARWIGGRLSRDGECVIFLAAKDYDGAWSRLLTRELSLLVDVSLGSFLRAVRATGLPFRIIFDGINELGSERDAALRGLRALVRRLDARLVVTGQSGVPDQLGGLELFTIAPPSLALKERIALVRLPTTSASLQALLKAVPSGFEAAIVAEIGADARADASRQLLVDQFIRQRLGPGHRAGAAGLRRLALKLVETTSFSLNETVFDDLMIAAGLSGGGIEAMFVGDILVRRGGRVSFAHEILLNACAASGFAQHAPVAGAKFAFLLALPTLAPIAADILSVIEERALVLTILETSEDHALLFEAARGLAGPVALDAADEILARTEAAIEAETSGLRLALVPGDHPPVVWEEGGIRDWTRAEEARLNALARMISTGHRIERYFELCAAMDTLLLAERRRLWDAATVAGIKALRSFSFRLAYSTFVAECALARISRMVASGIFDLSDPATPQAPLDMMSLTSGQLYFYLRRRRLFLDSADVDILAETLAELIRERFRGEPDLVKFEILHALPFVRLADPDKIETLVEAVEAIDADREGIMISTAIIEALKYLGALEESAEGAREGIAGQFRRALQDPEDEGTRRTALVVSTAMFDHPYDTIYGEEFDALELEARRELIRRAARSEDARASIFLSWLMRELASFDDPADVEIMRSFATLPQPRNSFPQEEWGAFTVATRYLGRHHLRLPERKGASDAERALLGLQALLHAIEAGLGEESTAEAWRQLNTLPDAVVIGCLSEMEGALSEQHWSESQGASRVSLIRPYAQRWLAIARRFLDSGEEARHFRAAHDRDKGPELAFTILEHFGDRSDLDRLRRLANQSRIAARAIAVLRKLDAA